MVNPLESNEKETDGRTRKPGREARKAEETSVPLPGTASNPDDRQAPTLRGRTESRTGEMTHPRGCLGSNQVPSTVDIVDEENESPWKDRVFAAGNRSERNGFHRGTRP